jgi:hypothetical protein
MGARRRAKPASDVRRRECVFNALCPHHPIVRLPHPGRPLGAGVKVKPFGCCATLTPLAVVARRACRLRNARPFRLARKHARRGLPEDGKPCGWPPRVFESVNISLDRLAVTSSHVYIPRYDDAPRSNRLFSRREAQGAATEVVEVGDLSRRKIKPDRAVIGVFREHGNGQQGRKRSPQAAVGQAPFRTPGMAAGVTGRQSIAG